MAEKVVSVSLPTSTLYVSGTVNGVACIWTNTDGDVWETTVERAENDIYYVDITAINSSGASTSLQITLYYGLNLVTDRSQSDVARIKTLRKKGWSNMTEAEQEEYLAGMKGAYNATDLNRVESAVEFVNDYLDDMQSNLDAYREEQFVAADALWRVPFEYPLELEIKKGWVVSDLPTESELERYLSNVSVVTDKIPIDKDLPTTMQDLAIAGANEIERALLAEYAAGQEYESNTKRLIENTAKSFVYSGEIYGGVI